MPRKTRRKKTPLCLPGDPTDPAGFPQLAALYLETLRVRAFSPSTTASRAKHLVDFARWAAEHGITRPNQVTRPVLERYQRHLFYYRKTSGLPLSFSTQNQRLVSLRAFFRFLAKQSFLLFNPASELESPRPARRLPRFVLAASEVEQILALPDTDEPAGLRDRALLETFYSTGIRRAEIIGLVPADLDPERGTLQIREGKGRKDRLVPIGNRALRWIERYLLEARPCLACAFDPGNLFLSSLGRPLAPDVLSRIVRRYIDRAQLGKTGSCHLFRHSMATLMLDAGADVRYLQEILGHAQLSTTQLYTHVSIRRLKAIHAATHPAENPEPRDGAGSDAPQDTGGEPVCSTTEAFTDRDCPPPLSREQLLEVLDAERDDEESAVGSPLRPGKL